MRRWCRGEWGVMEGLGTYPENNHFFVPQNDKFGCIFPQFLTGRKHRSLVTRIIQFNREITKLTKTVPKSSKNSRSETTKVSK